MHHLHDPSAAKRRLRRTPDALLTLLFILSLSANAAAATVTEFGPFEDGEIAWERAVGSWQTIDFTGVPVGTFLTDEFLESDGITFSSFPQVVGPTGDFVLDGFGILSGIDGHIEFTFATPLRTVAFDLPGSGEIEFFAGDERIAGPLPMGFPGVDRFSGYISDTPFDRIVLSDQDALGIDDLRYGMVVPGPGAVGIGVLAGLAGFAGTGRRRRC
mgnify:CR=1 FL=1